MRVAAQLLHQPRSDSVVDVVRNLCGVQAQVLSAAGLALRARTNGLKAQQVDRARTRDRSIVLTWAMRGTLHLVAAEDYPWLIPLVTEPHVANAHRRLKQEGVLAGQPDEAVRHIAQMLKREGPLTRKEIAEHLKRLGIHTAGQAIAHLVWLAAAQGLICYGPDRDGEHCFVRVEDWLGKSRPVAREKALANLAVRYLNAHAPATPRDLVFWSGIRMVDAKRAWTLIGDRLHEVETPSGPCWTLRSTPAQAPPGIVRLLPAFDEYLLGWKDREFAVAGEHRTKINRGGGWLHPVVLADGRAVGTWRTKQTPKKLRIELEPFGPLTPAVKRGAAKEASDVAEFLGMPVELK
jgi:winged helix DNA-binding protein